MPTEFSRLAVFGIACIFGAMGLLLGWWSGRAYEATESEIRQAKNVKDEPK